MARGLKCRTCKTPMIVESEKKYPAGSEVVYKCNNKVKQWEDK